MPSIKSATDNLYRELAINNGSTPPAVYKAAIELANAAHDQLTGEKTVTPTKSKPKAKGPTRKSISPSNERMDATENALADTDYNFRLAVNKLADSPASDRLWQHIYAAVLYISHHGGAATHDAIETYLKGAMPQNNYTAEYIRATTAALYRRKRLNRAYVAGTNKYAYSSRQS